MGKIERWDADQKIELDAGRSAGVDVSLYENPNFLAVQMRQIRLGLEEGLDASVYAKEEYDWFQMEELRLGLASNVNIKKYSDPKIPYDVMRQVRKGLENGLDLSGFINLKPEIIRELRRSAKEKINIIDYVQKGYDAESLREIRHGLAKKLRFAKYLDPSYRGAAIHEIIQGVEHNLDVSVYADIKYSWQQMREIRIGMEHQLDVTRYANPLFQAAQMKEIREGLEEGLDVTPFASLVYTATDMRRIREDILERNGYPQRRGLQSVESENYYLYVTDDGMEARLVIKGNRPGMYTVDALEDIFTFNGIFSGILHDEVDEIVSMGLCESRVIARGCVPTKGTDGYYEFFVDTSMIDKPKIQDDGSVDYYNMERFLVVHDDEPIALYHPAKEGRDGYTVYGEPIAAIKGKELKLLTGKGFRILDDKRTYISTTHGRILIDKTRLTVDISPTCVVQDVNITTGNVNFDGSVHVFGDVAKGSSIICTEDLVIDGSVEACNINAGGNVLIRKGVNGMGDDCVITAGGNVEGAFFEAVTIIAKGNFEANYCLGCLTSVSGYITVSGRKGILAGGKTSAVRGIECFDLGNRAGIATYVSMGVNEAMRKEEFSYIQKIAGVEQELGIFQSAVKKFEKIYPPEVRNAMDQFIKLENAVFTKEQEKKKFTEKLEELQRAINTMENAKARVRGTMFEGVTFDIDRIRLNVSTRAKNVTVTRETSRIVVYQNN